MRKFKAVMCIILLCLIHTSLFAGGKRETPTKHNVYAGFGYPYVGAGYEGAIGSSFSLGAYLGYGIDNQGIEVLLKPRIYFGSALERFFIGANAGIASYYPDNNKNDNNNSNYYDPIYGDYYSDYYEDPQTEIDLNVGLNLGYKFVFGRRSGGFALEPSIGFDYMVFSEIPRFKIGLNLGYAWGGGGVAPRPAPAGRVQDGIYVGIITFGSDATDLTGGAPILLDSSGLTRLTNLINNRYEKEKIVGTTLFYAAHMGLANLKKAEPRVPQNLKNVTMVTFTDGLDNGSSGMRRTEITDPAGRSSLDFRADRAGENAIELYRDYVQKEIRKPRTVNGTPLEAYMLAIEGDDVTDTVGFEAARGSLASVGDQYGGNRNITWEELIERFNLIADGIIRNMTNTSFTMVSPEYPPGTRMRMTFNAETASEVSRAQSYFEGTIEIQGMDYYFSNISYGGPITSAIPEGGRIKGVYNTAGELTYVFPGFQGFDFSNKNQYDLERLLKQWQMSRSSTSWQINTEYRPIDVSVRTIERHNAVIYLVLDKSSSIADADVPKVKKAVTDFIQNLYNGYYQR